MDLDWNPEASAVLNGQVYAFGAKFERSREDNRYHDGVLKAALFDGKKFVDVPGAFRPERPSGRFWLKAVTLEGRVAILWRRETGPDDRQQRRRHAPLD